jgi:hypothetical protein
MSPGERPPPADMGAAIAAVDDPGPLARRRDGSPSDHPEQGKYQQHNKEKSEAARGVVAPGRAVGPRRQRAHDKKNKDDDENKTQWTNPPAKSRNDMVVIRGRIPLIS